MPFKCAPSFNEEYFEAFEWIEGTDSIQKRIKAHLDRIFLEKEGPRDVQELRELILALVKLANPTMRMHTGGQRRVNVCVRKGKRCDHTIMEIFCRYLFARELFPSLEKDMNKLGRIFEDPYRLQLRNMRLRRNDALLNNFEQHLLLANLGNIDWRAVLNLWSVLDYLTKYASKPEQGSKTLKALYEDDLKNVCVYS